MMSAMGIVGQDERGGKVHFERRFDVSPEELWPYLTEAAHLAGWITPQVEFEARVGGRVAFYWPGNPVMEGTVLVCDAPRRLEYTWREGEADSVVKLELKPVADGTLLIVDHIGLPVKEAPGFGAGWHSHFDWLELRVRGAGDGFDEQARFRELARECGYEVASA